MGQVVLEYKRETSILPLVQAALQNEVNILEVGIKKTEAVIREFEKKYNMATNLFLKKMKNGEIDDEIFDFTDWEGEYHLLLTLKEKRDSLKEVSLCE